MCTTNYEHKMMLLQNFPIVNTRLQRQQYSTFVWYFTVFRIRVFFRIRNELFFWLRIGRKSGKIRIWTHKKRPKTVRTSRKKCISYLALSTLSFLVSSWILKSRSGSAKKPGSIRIRNTDISGRMFSRFDSVLRSRRRSVWRMLGWRQANFYLY